LFGRIAISSSEELITIAEGLERDVEVDLQEPERR